MFVKEVICGVWKHPYSTHTVPTLHCINVAMSTVISVNPELQFCVICTFYVYVFCPREIVCSAILPFHDKCLHHRGKCLLHPETPVLPVGLV